MLRSFGFPHHNLDADQLADFEKQFDPNKKGEVSIEEFVNAVYAAIRVP